MRLNSDDGDEEAAAEDEGGRRKVRAAGALLVRHCLYVLLSYMSSLPVCRLSHCTVGTCRRHSSVCSPGSCSPALC